MLTLHLSQFDQIKACESFRWGEGITITMSSNPPVIKITALVVNRKWGSAPKALCLSFPTVLKHGFLSDGGSCMCATVKESPKATGLKKKKSQLVSDGREQSSGVHHSEGAGTATRRASPRLPSRLLFYPSHIHTG